jgi:hypothetical protein
VRLRVLGNEAHTCSCSAPAAEPVWRQHFCLPLAAAAVGVARLRVELWWSAARAAGPEADGASVRLGVGEVALPSVDSDAIAHARCVLKPARCGCLELELTVRALGCAGPPHAARARDAFGFPVLPEHARAHARACARVVAFDAAGGLGEWNALVQGLDARARALTEAEAAAARALVARSGNGVPLAHRAEVWRRALGTDDGPAGAAAVRARYDALVREAGRREASGLARALGTAEQIRRDLPRTFPAHGAFGPGGPLSRALGRLLRALAVECPAVGYCQSLNFVGALLLLLADEPRAFGLLRALCRAGLPDYWTEALAGVRCDTAVLADALARAQPSPCTRLRAAGVPLELVLTRWLLCGFANLLAPAAVFALWDRLCLQAAAPSPSGALALFEAAAALLGLARDRLRGADDPSSALGALEATGASLYDPRPLLAPMDAAEATGASLSDPRPLIEPTDVADAAPAALCATRAQRDALHAARAAARAAVVAARYEALAGRVRLPKDELARAHAAALARLELPAHAIDHAVSRAELGALLGGACAARPQGTADCGGAGGAARGGLGGCGAASGARELGERIFDLLTVTGDPLGDDSAALLAGGHATLPVASAVAVLVAAQRCAPVGIASLCFYARATDGDAAAPALGSAAARALLRELEATFREPTDDASAPLPTDAAVAELVGDGVARWKTVVKLLATSGVLALVQRRLDGLRLESELSGPRVRAGAVRPAEAEEAETAARGLDVHAGGWTRWQATP